LPRISSSASGFFFCGISDEPVEYLREEEEPRRRIARAESRNCAPRRIARGARVGELDEAKLLRAVDDEVLGEAREVRHQQRAPADQLDHEVAVGHRVERVARRPREAEVGGERLAVDAERVARERARAERALVHPRDDLGEAVAVALPRPRVREHPVAPADWLRRLQVGVPRHQDVDLGARAHRRRAHERLQ